MNAILEILAKNATATAEQIAAILNRPAEDVRAEIQRMEEEKIIPYTNIAKSKLLHL